MKSGKTKDLYLNDDGTYTFFLKDDATGKDGVFDPGENQVGLSIPGLGRESLRLTTYFFKLLEREDVPTCFVKSDLDNVSMTVEYAELFGNGLEFICRRLAGGSFLRRYGEYSKKGDYLNFLVEVTLKNDASGDPLITCDSLVELGIMSLHTYEKCKTLTKRATKIITKDLASMGLDLADIKFEFGKVGKNIVMIDEISAGSMRVYKQGRLLPPMELAKILLDKET